ncbi:spore germination protein (amino acid permease) [Cohnella sp. OV330]|uniref:GerAB/ArcD/ProY family transporter n=1 Tax=Cohnella sp. OV330 TaxID=1855288 RepID=UPI0008E923AD|nr:GerAB/ArcD/ProY family transporter [Cohnella sp. OV330]SFB39031.1 spore germination protein (amino acid permease) [Cohnella sp. OV330]
MKEKLNGFHVALLIFMIELDVTVFMLPRMVAVQIGTNGWLGFLGLSLIAAFNIWLYRLVYRAGQGRSVFDISEAVLPKIVLYPLYASLSLLWLGIGAFAGKSFVLVFQTLSFQTSPPMQIFAVYCLLVYALLAKDLYSIVKASTVFFLLSIWMLVLAPYFFKDWSIHRFTAFFFHGTENGHSLSGMLDVYAVFIGYELCVFLFPFSDAKTKLFKGVFAGHAIITATYLLTILVSFGFFSFEEVKILQFPLIHTLEYIEMPFINRVENLVFPFFLFSNLVTTVMFAFAARSALGRMLPGVEAKRFALPLAAAVFALGFLPSVFREAAALIRLTYFTETCVAFILPLLLLILIKIGGKTSKEASSR